MVAPPSPASSLEKHPSDESLALGTWQVLPGHPAFPAGCCLRRVCLASPRQAIPCKPGASGGGSQGAFTRLPECVLEGYALGKEEVSRRCPTALGGGEPPLQGHRTLGICGPPLTSRVGAACWGGINARSKSPGIAW